jgi:hypothetical protein
MMCGHSDLEYLLIEYLKKQGIKESSIVIEWPIDNKYHIDVAIVDSDLNKALALFEIKAVNTKTAINNAIKQLRQYQRILGYEMVPLYVVVPSDNENIIEILHINENVHENNADLVSISKFPKYSILKQSLIEKTLYKISKDKEDTIDKFKAVCFLGSIGLIIILIVDFFSNPSILTNPRLFIICLCIALFIIPFANKLKILGVLEYEAKKIQKKDKD